MKKIVLFVLLIAPFLGFAQDFSNTWEEFYSYFHIKAIVTGDHQIFTAAENAIFITQPGNLEQEKITTLQGLSGETISALAYFEDQNTLIIGYENGLIQLYNLQDKSVKTFIDILQKPTITPDERRINHFFIYNNTAYIATNYGISEFNLSQKEFGDTYYIGDAGSKLKVNAAVIYNQTLYAATESGGLRYVSLSNPNKVDYQSWSTLEPQSSFKSAVLFNQKLYVLNQSNSLLQLLGSSLQSVLHFGMNVKNLQVSTNYLSVTGSAKVVVYNTDLAAVKQFTTSQFSADFSTALTFNNSLYIGDQAFGLLRSPLQGNNAIEFMSPNGPLRNAVFALAVLPNSIWVSYGEVNFYYNPYPLKKRGISHFSNEHWRNIPYSAFSEDFRSIVDVCINPQETNQVFFASYHDGLMEVTDEEITQIYTTTNSNLDPTDSPVEQPDAIRLGPSAFDNEGNLWIASALSNDGLLKLPPGGGPNSFEKINVSDIIPQPEISNGVGDLVIDESGNVYFGSYLDGVIGYNPRQEKFAKIKGGENQGNLPDNYVSALALDQTNQLWIGTKQGLRVLYGPSRMFENPNISANNIVFLDDEGLAQELFAGLSITDITVDGNNNKWVASNSGAYYVSSDGQKTIYHFTTENSPLPSNNINAIKIDNSTGKVYFATQKGLVAYNGSATAGADNLNHVRAYPNPVRPNYHGLVTIDGLMADAHVKITDIEGNLVYETVSEGGSIQWDTTAFGRYRVASGVYLVMISSDDQLKTKITKIMIIR